MDKNQIFTAIDYNNIELLKLLWRENKDNIKSLNSSIEFMKMYDERLKEIVLNNQEKYNKINIIVEGEIENETKEIYDSCWNMIYGKITYGKAKKIIRESNRNLKNFEEYLELCKNYKILPINPAEEFRNKFKSLYDYFGNDKKDYIEIEEYKKEFNKSYTNEIDIKKLVLELSQKDRYPHPDIILNLYNIESLNDLVYQKCYRKYNLNL